MRGRTEVTAFWLIVTWSFPNLQNLVSTCRPSFPWGLPRMYSPMRRSLGPYMSAVSNVVMPELTNASKSATALLPVVLSSDDVPLWPPASCQLPLITCSLPLWCDLPGAVRKRLTRCSNNLKPKEHEYELFVIVGVQVLSTMAHMASYADCTSTQG